MDRRFNHPPSPGGNCSVCGKKANFRFYGVVTCDSCRTFFRRGVLKNLNAKCIDGHDRCVVNVETVKKCTSCRYRKCIKVGMRSDFVSNPQNASSDTDSSLIPLPSWARTVPRPGVELIDTHIQGLTSNEKSKLFEMMRMIQSTILKPEDCRSFVGDYIKDVNTVFLMFITRVIKGLSTLKGADGLDCEDKKVLLKNSVGKIIYLRSVPQFDIENQSWNVYKDPVSINQVSVLFKMIFNIDCR